MNILMQKRFVELDLLRGLAIIGMIVYHLFFVLNFYGVLRMDLQVGGWQVLAQIVRFLFLGLVGVGMVISYERILGRGVDVGERGRWSLRWQAILRQWKRALIVLAAALIVNVGTFLFIPDSYVRFGILHLIAVSIFFWSFFVEWKWPVLVLLLMSFWLGGVFGSVGGGSVIQSGSFPFFTHLNIFGLNFGYFLRDMSWGTQAVDYFPLFPWMGLMGVGIFLGHLFYPKGNCRFGWREKVAQAGTYTVAAHQKTDQIGHARKVSHLVIYPIVRLISSMGRHSLLIYVMHVPVIVAVLWVLGLARI